jgi:hypothetical protein
MAMARLLLLSSPLMGGLSGSWFTTEIAPTSGSRRGVLQQLHRVPTVLDKASVGVEKRWSGAMVAWNGARVSVMKSTKLTDGLNYI